jgi:hypothetical protein
MIQKKELKEVSKIGIKTFSIKNIGVSSTIKFDRNSLPKKLDLLEVKECLPKNFSETYDAIGMGDAIETALSELFERKEEIALIVEWRVLTLHREQLRKYLEGLEASE